MVTGNFLLSNARLVSCFAIASAIAGTVAYEITLGIVGVALPHMQGNFSATPDQIAWVLTAFTVGTTIMIGCSGWFSSRFGRKRFFLLSLAGFIVAPTMCGSVDSLVAETAWRFIQGLLGAPLMPLGQAITADCFPQDKQSQASSVWAMGAVGGVVTAPVIGGFLVEYYGWRWVFYVTLPFAALGLFGGAAFISETVKDAQRKLDWIAFLTLVVAIVALQLALSRGEREGWFESREIVTEMFIAAMAMALFVARNLTSPYPFIPLELVRDWNFNIGALMFLVFGAVLILPVVLLPLLLQQLGGYPVFTAGALLLPRGIGTIIALLLSGMVFSKTNPKTLLIVGFIFIGMANWRMSTWTPDVAVWEITWTTIFQGFGSGITFVPNIAIAFWTVSSRYRTEGLSFLYLLFYFGSAIGVAAIFAFQSKSIQINRSVLVENITRFNEMLRSSQWHLDSPSGLAAISREIDRQAETIAYSNTFLIIAVTALLMLPLILMIRKSGGDQIRDRAGGSRQ